MEKAFTGIKDQDLLILSNLNDRDLLNVCSIKNKYIIHICEDENFWRNRFISKHGEVGIKYKSEKKSWKNYYLQVIIDLEIFSEKYPNPYDFLSHVLWNKNIESSSYIEKPVDILFSNNWKPISMAKEWVISSLLYYKYDLKNIPIILRGKNIEIKEPNITLFNLLNLISESIQTIYGKNVPFRLIKFKGIERISIMMFNF